MGGRPGDEKGGRGTRDGPGARNGNGPDGYGAYLRYLHLGWQMALCLLIGVFGGVWLDGRLGCGPVLTVTGSILGIGLGMAVLIREAGKK